MLALTLPLGWRLAIFLVAGVAGGIANGIAGGGTFLNFPTLLALGIPALQANVLTMVGTDEPLTAEIVSARYFRMIGVNAEFGRVFNRDQALSVRDVLRHDVQQGRFTGTGASGDHDADARFDRAGNYFHHLGRDRLQFDQLVCAERAGAEAANRE